MERSVRSQISLGVVDMSPSRKRLYRYTLVVLVVSLISNIPIFLEFRTGIEHKNGTQVSSVEVTKLRMDENYIIFFKNGFEGIILMILPLTVMVYFNARIIYTFNRRGSSIICGIGPFRQIRNEMNLAKVLVAMDIVFLICNLGRVSVNVWELFHIQQMKECMRIGFWMKVDWFWKTKFSL